MAAPNFQTEMGFTPTPHTTISPSLHNTSPPSFYHHSDVQTEMTSPLPSRDQIEETYHQTRDQLSALSLPSSDPVLAPSIHSFNDPVLTNSIYPSIDPVLVTCSHPSSDSMLSTSNHPPNNNDYSTPLLSTSNNLDTASNTPSREEELEPHLTRTYCKDIASTPAQSSSDHVASTPSPPAGSTPTPPPGEHAGPHACGVACRLQCGWDQHEREVGPVLSEVGAATSYRQTYDIRPPVSLNEILAERERTCLPPASCSEVRNRDAVTAAAGREQDDAVLLRHLQEQQSRLLASMGNGASGNKVCSSNRVSDSGQQDVKAVSKESSIKESNALGRDSAKLEKALAVHGDYEYLKGLIPQLKKENKEWEEKCCCWETQVTELKRQLKTKEQEVVKLQREVHKLKSVLQQATSFAKDGGDLLSSLQDQHGMAGQQQLQEQQPQQPTLQHTTSMGSQSTLKKQGVSGESSEAGQMAEDIQIQRYDKDFRSKQLIRDAIMDNDFLKNLDSSQVREVVDSMYPTEYEQGSYVINEGEAGSHLYVAAEGEFEVVKEDKVLGRMGAGKAFGELAILYNCTRTASIRVVADSKVWVLDRRVFQRIMMRTGLQRSEDNVNFLRSVPLLANLNRDVLAKMADVMEVEFYPADAYILRQGAHGDTFFIISQGCVKVTQRLPGRREEEEIRTLERGDYFGEQALLKEDCRTATIIAQAPGVEVLTLDRESFTQLIGDLSELHEKDYGDESRGLSRPASSFSISDSDQELDFIRLEDLDVLATLGVGGFGRVELVQYSYDKSQTFALKCLKKRHIVDTQQQEHVFSEKAIMLCCRSPFICRLYRTFKDSRYVYMLLEACLGGEVWTILRDRGHFDDNTTRFVTACVVEAFEYLHTRGIIYRDLKPENLLLDTQGYVKLVDFGFSKRLGHSAKTWTFCGTPEYVAPEIILNKGHDRAVDYWSLGVLMHELLTGTPPFTATDPMKTYNIILKGIDMINFPRHITRTAQSLIKKLCRDAPSERLGYQRGGISDIKKNKWFQGFDWDGLKQRSLTGPILPKVKSPTDTSNFDIYPKDADFAPEEFSNWEAEF